jgi:predicted DNA-binding protein
VGKGRGSHKNLDEPVENLIRTFYKYIEPNLNLMRTFSIRLDDELFQKLESSRGENPRADYIREVLISHFQEHTNKTNLDEPTTNRQENLNEPLVNLIKENEALKAELTHKEQINKIMEARVKDLQDHNGFLISEYSKLSRLNEQLLLNPAPEEKIERKWWQFWKT